MDSAPRPTGRTDPPRVDGRYIIGRKLAEGSMGEVFECEHAVTGQRYAIKILFPHVTRNPTIAERFDREVRAAGQINHPGVVATIDAGTDSDGRMFLVMELLRGVSLREWLESARGTRREVMGWMLELLDALSAAHAVGVVHRDIKPANVFITAAGHAKLLDFGIARGPDAGRATQTGFTLGTPHYMSPEQSIDPRNCGPAADVWSVGVMLYELISGEVPFDGTTITAICLDALDGKFIPLSERVPDVDPALAVLVHRCLNPNANSRPADASVLHAALASILDAGGRFGGSDVARAATPAPLLGGLATAPGTVEPIPIAPVGRRFGWALLVGLVAVIGAGVWAVSLIASVGPAERPIAPVMTVQALVVPGSSRTVAEPDSSVDSGVLGDADLVADTSPEHRVDAMPVVATREPRRARRARRPAPRRRPGAARTVPARPKPPIAAPAIASPAAALVAPPPAGPAPEVVPAVTAAAATKTRPAAPAPTPSAETPSPTAKKAAPKKARAVEPEAFLTF